MEYRRALVASESLTHSYMDLLVYFFDRLDPYYYWLEGYKEFFFGRFLAHNRCESERRK